LPLVMMPALMRGNVDCRTGFHGGTYEAIYLTQAEYDAIADSANEPGGRQNGSEPRRGVGTDERVDVPVRQFHRVGRPRTGHAGHHVRRVAKQVDRDLACNDEENLARGRSTQSDGVQLANARNRLRASLGSGGPWRM
jgi:hypothetical protein